MKQNYSFVKLFMLTVMVFFAGNAMAEDIIWSEDFSSYADKDVPSGGAYSYVCEGTIYNDDGTAKSGTRIYGSENTAGGTAPELLVAKNGGSFSATVPLGGRSGDMTLQFKTNRNDLKVEVTGATLGEKVRTGNTDSYPLTGASGTVTIKFFMSSSSNARLDDIKLFQGQGLKPAGLSWGKASSSVTLGDEESYKYLPTLSNENGLTVTCTSSEEAVATVNSNGVITVVGVGKTTITASFAGNSEYEAQTVSVEITVKENSGDTPPTPTTELTVAEALEKINALGTETTGYVDNKAVFQVKGYVVGTPDWQRNSKNNNALYGNVEFKIADEKGGSNTLTVYHCKNLDNASYTEETINNFKEGDLVVVEGILQMFVKNGVGTPEISSCHLVSINGSTTGINNAKAELNDNAPAYNVAGQKVGAGFKGIVIKNGKKVIVK